MKLKTAGYTPKQIEPLISAVMEEDVSSTSASVPIIDTGMDFVERYKVHALGRLLQIVSQKICNNELLRDGLIIVSHLSNAPKQWEKTVRVSLSSKSKFESLIRKHRQIPIGWSTIDGEVFTRFKDIEVLNRRLDTWEMFSIELDNPEQECAYEIALGIARDSSDSQLIAIKSWLSQDNLPISVSEQLFLSRIIEIILQVIMPLEEIIKPYAYDRLQRVGQGEMLSVLANFVVHIAPDKWDYCGVLQPFIEDSKNTSSFSYKCYLSTKLKGTGFLPNRQFPSRLGLLNWKIVSS